MMKQHLLGGLLAAASMLLPLSAAEKIFDLSFDDYTVTPQIAKGDKQQKGFTEPDLQLRMFRGINDKGNALNLGNREELTFRMPGNINLQQGTIIMWIAPQNWSIADKKYQLFFNAAQKGYFFRIAKTSPNVLLANIRYNIPWQGKKYLSAQVQALLTPSDWQVNRYHQIAVTWSGEKMDLYIDGKKPAKTPRYIGKKTLRPTVPSHRYQMPVKFPAASGSFTIGSFPWVKRHSDPSHSTAYDHVTIWDAPLSAEEIRSEYEKIVPPAKKQSLNELTIPLLKGSGKLTGDLSDPVWKKAVKVPLLPCLTAPAEAISAYSWHDGTNLYIGFSNATPCQVKKLKKHDDPLWYDDVFELYLLTPDSTLFQFIINGNNAIHDAQNRKSSWNSKLKSAVSHNKNGWSAELAIPLSELTTDTFTAEFCATSRPGIFYHLYRWSGSGKYFAPHGRLRLGKTAETMQIDSIGDPAKGNLKLKGFITSNGKIQITMDGDAPQSVPAAAGTLDTSLRLQPGRQQIALSTPGFVWHRELVVLKPLDLSFDYKMWSKTLDVTIDLNSASDAVKAQISKGLPVELTLKAPKGKIISSKKTTVKELKSTVSLKLAAVPTPGVWHIEAKSGDITTNIPWRCPDLAPYKAKLGADHTIPPPWTPVKEISKQSFQVWGRRYDFDNSPLPRQITHSNIKLLKSSPQWHFNGKAIKWQETKITARHPDFVTICGKGVADNAEFKWQGELWFDGAYILKMQLVPKGNISISDFGLNYAVTPAAGRYVMNPEYVKWENNKAEVQLGPGIGRKDNLIWLCGVEKGIVFWTQSNANWIVPKGSAPMTAIRSSDRSDVKVQIIGSKVSLAKPVEYTFTFMATPARPLDSAGREVNYFGTTNPMTTYKSIGWGQFHNRIDASDPIHFNTPYPAYPDKLKAGIERFRKWNDVKLHYYTMPGVLSDTTDDFDYWSKVMKTIPEISHSHIKGKRFTAIKFCNRVTDAPADYWTWYLNKLLTDLPGMGGLYFDCGSTTFCANLQHGCSGTDVFGQPFVTSDALGLRKFLLRVYKIHKRFPRATIMYHSHVQFVPFVHSFIDFFAPGENTFQLICRNQEYPYTEEVSLEEYQTVYNGRRVGIGFCMILQNARAAKAMPALKPYIRRYFKEPELAIRSITPFLIHDVNVWDNYVHRKTVGRYWKVRRDIKMREVSNFIGYWEDNCPVKSTTPKMYCSVYQWKGNAPYRHAIAVGNFTREEKRIGLKVDWKALGVEKPATVRELWTNRDIPVSELENFKLKGSHFAWFGVK